MRFLPKLVKNNIILIECNTLIFEANILLIKVLPN